MLKIAVASEDDMVAAHFGHCANFNIFEVENNQNVKSGVHTKPGASARFPTQLPE